MGSRVGVGEPGVDPDKGDVDAHPEHREQRRNPVCDPGIGVDERADLDVVDGDGHHHEHAAGAVEQRVPEAGSDRLAAVVPDHERARHRHQLPHEQEDEPVAGEGSPDRRGDVDERERDQRLTGLARVGIDDATDPEEAEAQPDHSGEVVDVERDDLEPEEGPHQVLPLGCDQRDRQNGREARRTDGEAGDSGQDEYEQRRREDDERRVGHREDVECHQWGTSVTSRSNGTAVTSSKGSPKTSPTICLARSRKTA